MVYFKTLAEDQVLNSLENRVFSTRFAKKTKPIQWLSVIWVHGVKRDS